MVLENDSPLAPPHSRARAFTCIFVRVTFAGTSQCLVSHQPALGISLRLMHAFIIAVYGLAVYDNSAFDHLSGCLDVH
jgi:hypothetical protein